jgi:1,3-beta-glucanosyltransferase GAS5
MSRWPPCALGGSSQLVDPLADPSTCERDIKYFQELGINSIRVYAVDNSKNHDTCMDALANAGIYLILDVNNPLYSLNRDDPGPSYNAMYLQSVFATIDAFASYDNTLAFFSGNEVINETTASTACAPYIKAVTRDMKQYIGNRGYRSIPVGYSAADVTTNRYETAEFMNCGTPDQRSDFFAFNDYSWCDPSSYEQSGWDQKVALFSNYSIPILWVAASPFPLRSTLLANANSLSEYGCNTNTRTFQEVASLYGTNMTPVYSGGLVYEYSQEANDYGLVNINGDNVTIRPDFTALQDAYENTPNPTGDGGYTTDNPVSQCPSQSSTWLPTDDTLPAIPPGAVQYMSNGAGPGPGLNGNNGQGSQNAGGASTGTATAGSGTPTRTATASSSAAAAGLRIPEPSVVPFVWTLILGGSALLGAFLL